MKKALQIVAPILALALTAIPAGARTIRDPDNATPIVQPAEIGKPAPLFKAADSTGTMRDLSAYKGKIVVLEWTNPLCPFTRKFYDTNAMQKLQQQETAKGVIWLSINSAAQGKEGFMTVDEVSRQIAKDQAHPSGYIIDVTGALGHLYGATATPDIYIINKDGVLVYAGAMDDQASVDHNSIGQGNQYVETALTEVEAGKPVSTPVSRAYGCAVKY